MQKRPEQPITFVWLKQSVHSKGLNAYVTMAQCYNVTMAQCYNVTCYNETIQTFKGVECICYNVTMAQCYNVTMVQCYNVTCYNETIQAFKGVECTALNCVTIHMCSTRLVLDVCIHNA